MSAQKVGRDTLSYPVSLSELCKTKKLMETIPWMQEISIGTEGLWLALTHHNIYNFVFHL